MQSGIGVDAELKSAFKKLTTSSSLRAIIAGIERERVSPVKIVDASNSGFFADLETLASHLNASTAAYILLRRHENVPDGYVAVTFVPDDAPVRQKMLFASTRLSLIRELGGDRFRESICITDLGELSPESWRRHELSETARPPLTSKEETLQQVREAEAAESRGTTQMQKLETGTTLNLQMTEEVVAALSQFEQNEDSILLEFEINPSGEMLTLARTAQVSPEALHTHISDTSARYSLYKYRDPATTSSSASSTIFIYTCPTGLKVRERMLYASSKQGFLATLVSRFHINVAAKFEVTMPQEITKAVIEDEFAPKADTKQAFSRPKRPGRR